MAVTAPGARTIVATFLQCLSSTPLLVYCTVDQEPSARMDAASEPAAEQELEQPSRKLPEDTSKTHQ